MTEPAKIAGRRAKGVVLKRVKALKDAGMEATSNEKIPGGSEYSGDGSNPNAVEYEDYYHHVWYSGKHWTVFVFLNEDEVDGETHYYAFGDEQNVEIERRWMVIVTDEDLAPSDKELQEEGSDA